jgi:hypothetical protein
VFKNVFTHTIVTFSIVFSVCVFYRGSGAAAEQELSVLPGQWCCSWAGAECSTGAVVLQLSRSWVRPAPATPLHRVCHNPPAAVSSQMQSGKRRETPSMLLRRLPRSWSGTGTAKSSIRAKAAVVRHYAVSLHAFLYPTIWLSKPPSCVTPSGVVITLIVTDNDKAITTLTVLCNEHVIIIYETVYWYLPDWGIVNSIS